MGPAVVMSIAVAALVTATISGILGMAGGLLLLGVYLHLLTVASAQVLHGVTQLTSNSSRALLLLPHVFWRALLPYLAGVALVFVSMLVVRVELGERSMYFVLGTVPLVGMGLARVKLHLRFTRRPTAFLCGLVVTGAHLTAGISGPLLDVFFVEDRLEPRTVVATKAITQALGHVLKVIYFAGVVGSGQAVSDLPWWIYPLAMACAFLGTLAGKQILVRLSDGQFRTASRIVITILCVMYLLRGVFAGDP